MELNAWNHERARQLQKRDGRTTEWLANFCGVDSVGVMRHYLSGRRKPKLPIIKLLAQAFNATEEELTVDPKEGLARKRASVAV